MSCVRLCSVICEVVYCPVSGCVVTCVRLCSVICEVV